MATATASATKLRPLGDRVGRKPVMLVTFSMMGIGIAGLCLTPSYSQIGIAAPILVLAFRLIEGFALGGEVGPSTAYMVEAAPPERRGLYGAMQALTVDASSMVAGVVGLLLALTLTDQQLQSWGWRIAMGLGVVIVPFGLWIRKRLPETLSDNDEIAPANNAGHATLSYRERILPHMRIILLGLLILTSLTIGGYTTNYMATYALSSLHMSSVIAFGAVIVSSSISVTADATGGWLSDKFGRKPVMLIPMALLVILILPAYWIIDHYRVMPVLYGTTAILAGLSALGAAPIFTLITEQLPSHIRSGALSLVYAFAISIFGGSTQFMETWLIKLTGNPMAPAFYWLGAALLGVFAVSMMRESAPAKISRAEAGQQPEMETG